jgi:hypothetical protein
MSGTSRYSGLIDGICQISKTPSSPSRYDRCDLAVDGTLFTLVPSDAGGDAIEGIVYFGDVGPLPMSQEQDATIELLETNLFLVGQNSPTFCWNPESRHVVLAGHLPLGALSAQSVLDALATLAAFAQQWRVAHQPATLAPPHLSGTARARRAFPPSK